MLLILLLLLLRRRLAFVFLVPILLAWLAFVYVVQRSWCWGQSDASIDRVSSFANDLSISIMISIYYSFKLIPTSASCLLTSFVGSRDSKHVGDVN